MTNNERLIEKYKDFDRIIKTYYQTRDKAGRRLDVDGLVNPLRLDFRQQCSVTDDQGPTSECAAYSVCGMCEALIWKRTGRLVNLNPDQVYAGAKQMDGMKNQDGTYLEYAIRSAFRLGGFDNVDSLKIGFLYAGEEKTTIEKLKFLVHKYEFLHVGFNISDGWYRCRQDNPVIEYGTYDCGGHAVLVAGYDPQGVYIQNSWGVSWGSKGFGILPWSLFHRQFIYACYVEDSLKF